MKKVEIILRLLRIPLDFFSVLAAFLLAYFARSDERVIDWLGLTTPMLMPFADFFWFGFQAAVLVVIILAWERMYSLRKSPGLLKELRRLVVLSSAGFTVMIVYFFATGVLFFSRFIFGLAFVLALGLMISSRLLLRLVRRILWKRGIGQRRVLFVGQGKILDDLVAVMGESSEFLIVAKLADPDMGELERVIHHEQADEVIQVSELKNAVEIVEYCQLNYIEYRFVPNMLEVQRTNTDIDFVDNVPIITLRSSAIDGWARVVKRTVDIIGSSMGLLILSPLLLLISIGIKLDDRGPVFYKSKRVSKNKQFWMWKFRSMVVNADHLKQELVDQNRRSGPLFKIGNDPRITRFGRFLRRTTLDELPQLWNVLRGDLSLVGPRAHLPEEVAQYEKHHRKVLAIKAGVTGLPQISGRSRLDFEKEVKLDVYYLENWSFWLDFKILLKTFGVLLEGE